MLAHDGSAVAATALIRSLGPELLGYLWVAAGSWGDGDDMFSEVCVRVWKGLSQFRWESSLRTWAYVIARNVVRASAKRSRRRHDLLPLMDAREVGELVAAIRSSTYATLEPAVRARFERLRTALDEEDRTILVLRVDRRMAWRDIADVLGDDGEERDRVASRLRKRFERIKLQLRKEVLSSEG